MGRDDGEKVREAAHGVLVEGERITSHGECWGAQVRARVPLLFLARRQYLLALTDRRLLVFNRRRKGPDASDLVIGKRYETFTLERVKRRRPLMQVVLQAKNGNRLVFEFRGGQRELGGELVARITPGSGPASMAPANERVPATVAATPATPAAAHDSEDGPDSGDDAESAVFWGRKD